MRQNVNQQRNNKIMRQQLVNRNENTNATRIQRLMRTRFGKIFYH